MDAVYFKASTCMLLSILLCFAAVSTSLEVGSSSPEIIPNEYIVVFQQDLRQEARTAHMVWLRSLSKQNDAEANFTRVLHEYTIDGGSHVFRGYAVHASRRLIQTVQLAPEVLYVEHNQVVHALQDNTCIRQNEATWGLERISKPDLPFAGYYEYQVNNSGAGVDAYIFDTGVRTTHMEFAGRARFGRDTTSPSGSPIETDDNGHGTFIAGIVGGTIFGAAKSVDIIGVKVLNQGGSGSFANVIAGLDYAAERCQGGSRRCVGTLALGGGFNDAMNDAVNATVLAGVFMAIAAGSSSSDACSFSPASASLAATVGSTDLNDRRAIGCNYGECVTLFAPGVSVSSAWYSSDSATITLSGSSASSAYVAGVAARLISHRPSLNTRQILLVLPSIGVKNKVVDEGQGSPNILLQGTCDLE